MEANQDIWNDMWKHWKICRFLQRLARKLQLEKEVSVVHLTSFLTLDTEGSTGL